MSRQNGHRPKRITEADAAVAARAAQAAFDRFLALSDADKTRETEELAKAASAKASRPLNPAEQQLWNRAKRGLGRPKQGRGAKPVNVTIERGLLERADAFAKRKGLTRSQIIAKGLQLAMGG